MRYIRNTDPIYVPQTATENNHIVIYTEMEKWLDKAGDKGVTDTLLISISMRLGEGSNRGNRKYFDYLVDRGYILPVVAP